MTALTTIEGIGPALEEKLKAVGVDSCAALLSKGATAESRRQLCALTGIDEKSLQRFVNQADLMRIRGVAGEYAELLEVAGVGSVPELAQRDPANLLATLMHVNAEKKLVRVTPGSGQIVKWVKQARALPRIVSR